MQHFTVTQPLPDVYHIQDAGQVCFTLIRGQNDTLLWDTGMGFYDVQACIAPFIRGKLHVVLSHGHYDHACGLHYFTTAYVHPDDLALAKRSISRKARAHTLTRMKARGVVPPSYADSSYLLNTPRILQILPFTTLDLGDLEIRFIHAPGHTQGSLVAFIPCMGLLLTGDMWNPTTWLFFSESQSLARYTKSMHDLLPLDIQHVLCAHYAGLVPAERLHAYIRGLNSATFAASTPCPIPPYTDIHTLCCHPEPETTLVFNGDKRD